MAVSMEFHSAVRWVGSKAAATVVSRGAWMVAGLVGLMVDWRVF